MLLLQEWLYVYFSVADSCQATESSQISTYCLEEQYSSTTAQPS